jgi:NAD(P) transhydrogenase
MFAALGVEVTVVEKADGILGFLDHDVTQALRAQMERTGIRVLTSEQVESVGEADPIPVRLKSGLNLTAEAILISAGRDGNTAGLGLEALGIAVNSRGQVGVNEHFQTAQPNIYAAGDVIGNPALASTAMEQARVAMVHAFDLKYKETISPLLPAGIYTVPECAMVGQTEEALKAKNIPYVAGKACYSDNVRGQIIGDNYGFLKLLFREPDLQLVGVHMMGEQATELVHIGLTAMQMSANADLFIRSCYNYPTLTEVYKYATYDALRNRGQASSLS